jgi:NADH-quinone oxidoreductase subunit G
MWEAHPTLSEMDLVTRAPWEAFGEPGLVAATPFVHAIADFYRTDPISRASRTMEQCSELFVARRSPAPLRTGTYG